AVVAAGGITRRRDGDAVRVRQGADLELLDDPALGEVVEDDGSVAVVARLAVPAETAPERVRRDRALDLRAGLRVDGEAVVGNLEVVVGADGAVRIRRRPAASLTDCHALEVDARGRDLPRPEVRLDDGVGLVAARRRGVIPVSVG